MPCTTILVGKNASYDGSTIIARNDDAPSGVFTAKRFVSVAPAEQPRHYQSVLSHVRIELPDNPQRYTAMPNANPAREGIWAAGGINASNVAMTATETITSNERVLGADPLVVYHPAEGDQPEQAGGIGEEDLVVLTLPYIHSAREGVLRLGALTQQYGTYEENGIAFSDVNEIWWFESVGGHHWIARRVPDDVYVVMPNQLGIDYFDLADALGEQKDFLCSPDLREFIAQNHLDVTQREDEAEADVFNPRAVFGSHDDADHVYNTPRAWYMLRYLNPSTCIWDGPDAEYAPESDDLPWCMVPENKVTVEDVKYVLSSHYQGTVYDPYGSYGEDRLRGAYRSIGINRNDFLGCYQIRPYADPAFRSIEWIAFASNTFNVMAPFYTNITTTPDYLSNTKDKTVSTDNFYWTSRLIAALSDACYSKNLNHIEHYQMAVGSRSHALIREYDAKLAAQGTADPAAVTALCEEANEAVAAMLKEEAGRTLDEVLYEASNHMKNQYARSDH